MVSNLSDNVVFIIKKENVELALQKYSNVVNDKITLIFDNLVLLSNSINDFFLKGQGKDENMALTSIQKAKNIEAGIAEQAGINLT